MIRSTRFILLFGALLGAVSPIQTWAAMGGDGDEVGIHTRVSRRSTDPLSGPSSGAEIEEVRFDDPLRDHVFQALFSAYVDRYDIAESLLSAFLGGEVKIRGNLNCQTKCGKKRDVTLSGTRNGTKVKFIIECQRIREKDFLERSTYYLASAVADDPGKRYENVNPVISLNFLGYKNRSDSQEYETDFPDVDRIALGGMLCTALSVDKDNLPPSWDKFNKNDINNMKIGRFVSMLIKGEDLPEKGMLRRYEVFLGSVHLDKIPKGLKKDWLDFLINAKDKSALPSVDSTVRKAYEVIRSSAPAHSKSDGDLYTFRRAQQGLRDDFAKFGALPYEEFSSCLRPFFPQDDVDDTFLHQMHTTLGKVGKGGG